MCRRKIYNQISGWEGVELTPQQTLATVLFFKNLKNQGKKITQEKVCTSNLNYGNGSQVASGTQLKPVTLSKTSEMNHQFPAISQTKTG